MGTRSTNTSWLKRAVRFYYTRVKDLFFNGIFKVRCAPTVKSSFSNTSSSNMSCRLPVLDPFHPSIMKYISATSYPECPGKQYGELVNERLQYSGDYFACSRGAHLLKGHFFLLTHFTRILPEIRINLSMTYFQSTHAHQYVSVRCGRSGKQLLSQFSTSIVSYRNVAYFSVCFLSGSVELMTSTQKKMLGYVTLRYGLGKQRNTLRYDTIEVENWFKCKQNTNHADK